MSAESFNQISSRIVTYLIAGTISGQYQWDEVNDERHIQQCKNEVGASSRLEGKIYSIAISKSPLRVFRYRNYVPLMTSDKSLIKTQGGSVIVVPEGDSAYVLEFYDADDFTSRVRLNPTNSVSDLYDTIVKHKFSVEDFLKDLEEDKKS